MIPLEGTWRHLTEVLLLGWVLRLVKKSVLVASLLRLELGLEGGQVVLGGVTF